VLRHIAGCGGFPSGALGVQSSVQQHRLWLHGCHRIRHMWQRVILDLNEIYSRLSDVAGGCRHSSYDMSMEQHLVPGKNLVTEIVLASASGASTPGSPWYDPGQIVPTNDGLHAG